MHTLETILCMGLGVHPHHAKTLCRRFVILAFPFSKRVQIGQMKQQSYNRSWLCKGYLRLGVVALARCKAKNLAGAVS